MNNISKLQARLLIITLTLGLLLPLKKCFAQNATATLFNNGSSSLSIAAGGTFTLNLNIVTTFGSTGITYFLRSTDGSGLFTVTGRNIGASPFTDLVTSDAQALGSPNGTMQPANLRDLGAVVSDPSAPVAAGSYFVSTLTLSVSASAAPGVYHIFLDNRGVVAGGPPDFADHGITSNQVTVNVVPEPATWLMLTIGAGCLVILSRRRSLGTR